MLALLTWCEVTVKILLLFLMFSLQTTFRDYIPLTAIKLFLQV